MNSQAESTSGTTSTIKIADVTIARLYNRAVSGKQGGTKGTLVSTVLFEAALTIHHKAL